jgi:hypothetical protein
MVFQFIESYFVPPKNPTVPLAQVEDFFRFKYDNEVCQTGLVKFVDIGTIKLTDVNIVIVSHEFIDEASLSEFLHKYKFNDDVFVGRNIEKRAYRVSATIVKTEDDGTLISHESLESFWD